MGNSLMYPARTLVGGISNMLTKSKNISTLAASSSAVGLTGILLLLLSMTYRALKAGKRIPVEPAHDRDVHEIIQTILSKDGLIAQHLSHAIQLRTVSFEKGGASSLNTKKGCACCGVDRPEAVDDSVTDPTPEAQRQSCKAFLTLHELLQGTYPTMHAVMERHVINQYSLVYIWRGSDEEASPIGFAAHFDVVPVPDAKEWVYPPFDGTIADGYVWGRGAIDDKQSVIGLCEAVETLASGGFQPRRTICLLFGHDEEVGGSEGAAAIATSLPRLLGSGKQLEWLLDEGLFLLSGFFPGVSNPTAVVCVGEKGHLNVELSVTGKTGHSSAPPPSTAIGILAKAITKIEASPFPAHLYPFSRLLEALLPYMPFPHRLLFANTWITWPLLKSVLLSKPQTAALLRTSTAVTLASGGLRSNVLPPLATAVINHRIHPLESVSSVLERDRKIINDERVTLKALSTVEPAAVSSTTAEGYKLIETCIKTVFGSKDGNELDPIAAPGTLLGNTDTKHYWSHARNIYRHCPTQLTIPETTMFHGRDERISTANLAKIAAFYAAMMALANKF